MSKPVPKTRPLLSAEALARAIHELHRTDFHGRQTLSTWEKLAAHTREQLTEAARRLQKIYAEAGDPPSRGIR